MALRGLNTRHSAPLLETTFLDDVGYGDPRPMRKEPFWFAAGLALGAVLMFCALAIRL